MRALALSLLTLSLLALAPAAAGAQGEGVTEQNKLTAAKPIAEAAFTQPNCESVTINLAADSPPMRGFAGMAWVNECRIDMRAGLDPITFCSVLAHEYGHIAGFGHADHWTNLMYWIVPVYEPCLTGTPASAPTTGILLRQPELERAPEPDQPRPLSTMERIRAAVHYELGAEGWTLSCRPYRKQIASRTKAWGRCHASRGTKRRTYIIEVRKDETTAYRER